MKLAFVFPGQGSQPVGMMDGFGDASRSCATRSPKRPRCSARTCGSSCTNGPAEALNLTRQHAAGDAHGGRRGVARVAGGGRRRARRDGGTQPRRIHARWSRPARSRSRTPCRWCAFAREAMQDAVPAGDGAMAAIMGGDDDADRRRLRRGRAGAGGRGGQLQCARPARHRRPSRRGRARDRRGEGAAARSARCCCRCRAPFHSSLLAPAAERLALRLAHVDVRAPTIPVLHNVDVATHADARRDPRGARAAGREPGALDATSSARWSRARRHARRRMRPRQGARPASRDASRRSSTAYSLDRQRGDRRRAHGARVGMSA